MAITRAKKKETVPVGNPNKDQIAQFWQYAARKSLPAFIQIASNFLWQPAPHLLALCDMLEAVERGEITRLRVTMPPRHGKSFVVSQHFPAWFLGRNPGKSVILTSYSADLAYDFSRICREVLRNTGPETFGVRISEESSAVDRWGLQGHRGAFMAAGVGGSITGRGASLIIIDDPVKNRETANSPVMREHTWQWYTSTLYTRLAPGGAIILVQTRWHEDDLYGRIEDRSEEDWVTLNLPAIAEGPDSMGRQPGDALWPAMFNRDTLDVIQREIGPYDFASLYQQHPIPKEGAMFRREWFPVVDGFPAAGKSVRRWDFAASEDTGDWTVGLLLTVHDGQCWVRDVKRMQGSARQVELLVKHIAEEDGRNIPIRWEEEGGSSGKMVSDHLIRHVLFGRNAKGVRSTGSKVERARPAAGMAEAGNIFICRGPWNNAFLAELESFPFGKHDDQIDALSGAISDIAMGAGKGPGIEYARGYHRAPI